MKKFKTVLILLGMLGTLSGCIQEEKKLNQEVTASNNIYSFTNLYEDNLKKGVSTSLKDIHKKSVDQIIESFKIFLSETKEKNFSTINSYAKQHDWELPSQEAVEDEEYKVTLKDGSDISIKYVHYYFKPEVFEMSIFHLNEKQCEYLMSYYDSFPHIKKSVERVSNGTEFTSANCSDINNDKYNIVVMISAEKRNGKWEEQQPDYYYFTKEVQYLMNKDYDRIINAQGRNVYFTERNVTDKDFRYKTDYIVNTKNNNVYLLAHSKERCEKWIYKLPDNVNYKVNDNTKCSEGNNLITIFK